ENAAALEALQAPQNASSDAERNQAARLVERVLDDLPLEQRAVFTLFELEEMSGDAIAELLDLPVGTVHSRLRLARVAFRRALARVTAAQTFRSVAKAGGDG